MGRAAAQLRDRRRSRHENQRVRPRGLRSDRDQTWYDDSPLVQYRERNTPVHLHRMMERGKGRKERAGSDETGKWRRRKVTSAWIAVQVGAIAGASANKCTHIMRKLHSPRDSPFGRPAPFQPFPQASTIVLLAAAKLAARCRIWSSRAPRVSRAGSREARPCQACPGRPGALHFR